MYDYLKSGRQAIRLIYFLIIGLAITDAMKLLFLNDGKNSFPSSDQWFLFVVFFSFVSRFFLGAYRVLSQDIEIELKRPKIVMDSIGFFLQVLAFYVFALNFTDMIYSLWMILIICVLDSVWLILLASCYHIMDSTFRQWIVHNLLMIVFVLLDLYWWKSLNVLFVVALLAFILDFVFNHDFYFALKKRSGLRIFVAAPYGDKKPKVEIDANVKKVRDVGKELVLKGHIPFIPHTMLQGWEMDGRFTNDHFKRIDLEWLEFCDALIFIAESPGTNLEKEIAIKKGLQIFKNLNEVPEVYITRES